MMAVLEKAVLDLALAWSNSPRFSNRLMALPRC
ncbi:MAG: hypothetical protein ACI9TA_003515, partial [Reinekea sp.]